MSSNSAAAAWHESKKNPKSAKLAASITHPTYIVDYIVENTVGKLLDGKTPDQAAKLRILDPACGSGSFLTGAYQYLLDWHLDYYRDHPRQYRNNRRETPEGMILTTAEKRRILLNSIYGVDLDQNAVEVSKLSLLLKMLENESDATGRQTIMFAAGGRILPDLSNNIKWGNSLIGSDFYQGKQMDMFDEEAVLKVKPFDWESKERGFGQIMAAGGFDAVIGNPPYIRIQTMKETAPETVPYYKKNYVSASKGNYDIYVVFVERGLQMLNSEGLLSYILPHKFFNAKYGQPLRGLIAKGKHLKHIVHFGAEQVFIGATTYTCLLFLTQSSQSEFEFVKAHNLDAWITSKSSISGQISDIRASSDWNFVVGKERNLFEKLDNYETKLKDVADRIFQGIIPGADKVYAVELIQYGSSVSICSSKYLEKEIAIETKILRKIISGKDVNRYILKENRERVIYPYYISGNDALLIPPYTMKATYPLAFQYFQQTRPFLEKRDRGSVKGIDWYKYVRTQNISLQHLSKLAVPRLVKRLQCGLDIAGTYCLDNVDVGGILLNDDRLYTYILGLLNSRLVNFYFVNNAAPFRGDYYSANRQYIEMLPIRTIDFDNPADLARHDQMVSLVDAMLDLHKQLPGLSGIHRDTVQAQIERVDAEIDGLVYELYGLTEDEIAIVEG